MLMPKKVKHRKQMKGRMTREGDARRAISFGEYGLKTLGAGRGSRTGRSRPRVSR